MKAKACTKCGETKPLADFPRSNKARDGRDTRCKSCAAAHVRAYNAANKEKAAARAKAYREAHKDAVDARVKAWHQANPERRAAHRKAWRDANYEAARVIERASYESNRDARLATKRQYAADNRARYTHYTQKRKAALGRATPKWADTAAIVAIYQQCADLTAATGIEHHVDHIVPLKGRTVSGLHVQNNLQILPANQNRRKYNRHDD